jgi:predicted O-methyltransferase YrrM
VAGKFFLIVLKYLHYLIFSQSRKGHGIHSPFVFHLVSDIFRNKTDRDVVIMIEKIRKKNLSDKRTIPVKDLGAGSATMKSSLRNISDIARHSAVPAKYGKLLMNLAAEFGGEGIVEFGTSLGISALYMAKGCPGTLVYTMEGCLATSKLAVENFSIAGAENIILLTGSFDDLITGLKVEPGMVFIDGDHRKESVVRYFRKMSELSDGDTVIVIDDIHLSKEMEEAWSEIKRSENVSFTVDIFRMGIVFFRKGINRCDYVIRY